MTTPTPTKPTIYVITTCPRCRRVKDLLDQMGIDYHLVAIDLLSREERISIIDNLRRYHPIVSFPVIEAGDVILVGTNVDEVRQVFGGEQ